VKKSSYIFTIFGIIILAIIIKALGFETTIDSIKIMGWNFFYIVLATFLVLIPLTYAWRLLIPMQLEKKFFFKLILARMIGEATVLINSVGILAGDGLKALYIKDRVPLKIGFASVLMNRTIHSMASVFIFLTGVIIAFFKLNISKYILIANLFAVIIILILFFMLLKKQKDGFFEFILLKFPLKLREKFLTETRWNKIKSLDKEMKNIFDSKKGYSHFYLSFFLHYVFTLLFHVLQIYLILYFVQSNVHLTLMDATLVFVFSYLVITLVFFMPGNLGTSEGAYSLAFKMLGYDPMAGLTVSVIIRMRWIFWSIVGIILLFHAGLIGKKDTSLNS